MTPKDLEDIRSWRRGEWAADITEIESMVYGLVDEIDRLRAAADGLEAEVSRKQICHEEQSKQDFIDISLAGGGYVQSAGAYADVLTRGRELGLFTDKP